MSVKLLTEQHLEFLSLKGSCTGSSESTLVKMPCCWKSHVAAHFVVFFIFLQIEAVNVGPLQGIIIGHDNSGPGPGWFLDHVTYLIISHDF